MVKEGAAVIDVGINYVLDPVTGKTKLVGDVDFEADYTEGSIALKFPHPCLEDHHSYCINGVCAFHHELETALCRCFTGYTGERCEHLTLTSYAVDSYEKYIAIGIGVGLLLSGFLLIFYCYIRKRYEKIMMSLDPPSFEIYLLSPCKVPGMDIYNFFW
uniref:Epigen n=1 Tax=Sus scrofa TaxID=9823 RepID=A0A8D0NEQ5_PIG